MSAIYGIFQSNGLDLCNGLDATSEPLAVLTTLFIMGHLSE